MRNYQNTNTCWLSSTLPGGKCASLSNTADTERQNISLLWLSSRSFAPLPFDGGLTLFDYSGHCKKLTPEYAAAATILAERNPPIHLAKVDATENNALSERFEVKGFPTLHWFV